MAFCMFKIFKVMITHINNIKIAIQNNISNLEKNIAIQQSENADLKIQITKQANDIAMLINLTRYLKNHINSHGSEFFNMNKVISQHEYDIFYMNRKIFMMNLEIYSLSKNCHSEYDLETI